MNETGVPVGFSHTRIRLTLVHVACAIVLIASAAASACGGGPGVSPSATATGAGRGQATPGTPAFGVFAVASDLAVGDDRLQLLLVGADGATLKPDASDVSVAIRPDQGGASIPLGTPVYYPWPGSRGAFVVRARFDSAGIWWADVDLPGMGTASAAFIVRDHSLSPAVGEAPPDADTRVATTAEGLKKITSDPNPDPAFYAISLEDAMQDGEPVVVAFGTPAYCETATCGPQLDELRTLRSEFGARVLFIHVEIYDNPEQIQGDLSRAILSPVVDAWQLPSDPWTFVIDRSGHIAGRYEGFTTAAELRPELERVLATP